jgi:hypothetical protein
VRMTIPARCVAANLHVIVFIGMQKTNGKESVCSRLYSVPLLMTPTFAGRRGHFYQTPTATVLNLFTLGHDSSILDHFRTLFSSRPHHFRKETSTVICTEPVLEPIRWLSLAAIRSREPPRVLLLSRTAPPHRVHVPLFWATTVPIPGDIYLPFPSNFVPDFPTWNARLGVPPLASAKQIF